MKRKEEMIRTDTVLVEAPSNVDRLSAIVLATNESSLGEVVAFGKDPGGWGLRTVAAVFIGALLGVAEPTLERPGEGLFLCYGP